jgi:hypothetical protein
MTEAAPNLVAEHHPLNRRGDATGKFGSTISIREQKQHAPSMDWIGTGLVRPCGPCRPFDLVIYDWSEGRCTSTALLSSPTPWGAAAHFPSMSTPEVSFALSVHRLFVPSKRSTVLGWHCDAAAATRPKLEAVCPPFFVSHAPRHRQCWTHSSRRSKRVYRKSSSSCCWER